MAWININLSKNAILEPVDSYLAKAFFSAVFLSSLLIPIWFIINMAGQPAWNVNIVYLALGFIALVLLIGDWIIKEYVIYRGGTPKAIVAFSFGDPLVAAFAVFAAVSLMTLSTWLPLTTFGASFNFWGDVSRIAHVGELNISELSLIAENIFIFFVWASPWFEEILRWAVVPTLGTFIATVINKLFKLDWIKSMWIGVSISTIVVSIAFALFHWTAYQGASFEPAAIGALIMAFFYSIMFTIGMYITKSAMFNIVWHYLHNFTAYMLQYQMSEYLALPSWIILTNSLILFTLFTISLGVVAGIFYAAVTGNLRKHISVKLT